MIVGSVFEFNRFITNLKPTSLCEPCSRNDNLYSKIRSIKNKLPCNGDLDYKGIIRSI